jgi:hypothetical protein
MQNKYNEYTKRYIWIAEGKEYNDSELWIKDFSTLELPEDDKNTLERKVHKVQIEKIEEEHEKEELKNEKKIEKVEKKEKPEHTKQPKEKKWRFDKVKNRFK